MFTAIEIIKKAAQERKVLRIIYIGKDGTSEGWRYVEPYSFSYQEGQIDGFFAWDIRKNGIRRFLLERINNIELTEQSFIPRFEIKINWL